MRKARLATVLVLVVVIMGGFVLAALPGGVRPVGAQASKAPSSTTVTNTLTVSSSSISLGSVLEARGQVSANGTPLPNASVALHMGDINVANTQTDQNGRYAFSVPVGANYFPAAFSNGATVYTVVEPQNSSFVNTLSPATSVPVNLAPLYTIIALITAAVVIVCYLFVRRFREKGAAVVGAARPSRRAAAPVVALEFSRNGVARAMIILRGVKSAVLHGLWIAHKDLLEFSRNGVARAMIILRGVKSAVLHGLWIAHKDLLEFSRNGVARAMIILRGVKSAVLHGLWIAHKDLLEFSRNRVALVLIIIMPLFMMGMVGYIFPSNNSISHVPVALVNLDAAQGNTSLSTQFVAQLQALNNKTGMMDLSTAASAADVKSSIQNGQQSAGIIIGTNFTSNLESGQQADVTLIIDQSNPQLENLVQGSLTQAIGQMGTQTAVQDLNLTDKTPLNLSLARVAPYNVQTTGVVSGPSNYFQFVAPGITAMVAMMALMTGLPHAISFERDVGTLDGLLAAPVHRMSIVGGKVIAQTVRGMIEGLVALALAIFLFGVDVHGSMALVLGLLLLTVFSIVGLGILVTSLAGTEETATMIMMSLLFPMMFFSGVFFPLQLMPSFMQVIAQFFPLTHAVTALRRVVVLGAGISAISTDVIILFGFGIVLLLVALVAFEWAMKQ
jgi:ABC-2 type transport system permease protein